MLKNTNKSAIVISAYPACGKSTFYSLHSVYSGHPNGLKILDSDSSSYSWIHDKQGNKIRNPKFPKNYINHIKSRSRTEDVIFVSSHKEVRQLLHTAGIPYISIYPKDTLANMKEWKSRFLDRGNTQAFINFQMEHWSEFIKDLDEDTTPIRKIVLDTETLTYAITDRLMEDIYGPYNMG